MKLKKLSIIFATLACLTLASNAFAEEQQSFIRKVRRGGFVSQSVQTRDGSYAYLNGNSITNVKDLSGKSISEVSLTFNVSYYYEYVSLREMIQTSDGFVLVGSFREDYYDDTKGIVVKVNMEGRVVWNKLIRVDERDAYRDGAIGFDSVIPTSDGGFIVTGWRWEGVTPSYPVVIKFSSRGNVLWSKSFDSLSRFFLSTPTLDGGVILATDHFRIEGQSLGVNVIKMNGSGNLVWAVTLEMKEFSLEEVTTLSDQGYLIAGKATDPNKLLLVRLNADGTIHSNAAYSLAVPDFSVSYLAQTPDDGIAIAGTLWRKTGSYYDGFLLKINARQQLTLKKRLGFPDSKESITTVFAKEDGSYLLFGSTWDGVSSDSDTLFVALNSNALTGCSFSHDLSASKVLFGNVNHKNLAITPKTFSIPPGESLEVTSERLNRNISGACAN